MPGSIKAGAFKTPRGLTSNRHAGRPDRQTVRAFAFAGAEHWEAVLCANGTNRCLRAFNGVIGEFDLFIQKLRARHHLSGEEEAALREMRWSDRRFGRHEVMVRAGEKLEHSMLLLSGFVLRRKFTAEGEQQILEINVTGDFIDLHGFILQRLDHEIVAASSCDIALVPHSELKRVTETFPRLGRILWFQTLIDAAINREWTLVLGKKRSRARVAQLFCEMHTRLGIVDQSDASGYALPFNQQELADITGMTPVHLNRCLKELRDAELVTYRSGKVSLLNLAALAQSAQFDPGYLHLGPHEI